MSTEPAGLLAIVLTKIQLILPESKVKLIGVVVLFLVRSHVLVFHNFVGGGTGGGVTVWLFFALSEQKAHHQHH
jgi:hypothetical protein